MKKLLELEKRLIKAREELSESLEKFGSQGPPMGSSLGSSIAAGIRGGGTSGGVNVVKKEMSEGQKKLDVDKDGKIESSDLAALRAKKKGMNKAEHPDEKEDKKLIAEAMDRHNEQKHGEAKDVDSAKKAMKLKKTEEISYLPNGQWSLEKARILDFPSGNLVADMGQPSQTTPPAGKLRDASTPPPVPSSTEEAAVAPASSMPKKDGARLPYYPSGEHFRGYSNTSKDTHEGYGKDPADLRRRQILSDMHVDSRSDLPDDSKWPHIKR